MTSPAKILLVGTVIGFLGASSPAVAANLDDLLKLGYRVVSVTSGEKVGEHIAFLSGEQSLYACRLLLTVQAGSLVANVFDRFDVCAKLNEPSEKGD